MRKISTILFLICCTLVAFSQQNNIQKEYNKEGTVSFLKFKNETAMKDVSQVKNLLRDSLKMKTGNVFELQSTEENKTGHTIRSYVQFYRGIKVEHGAYAVHSKNNKIEYIVGNYKDVEDVNVSPSLDEKSALKKALSYIKATKYKWEDKTEEENLKRIKNNGSASYFPKGELVIVKDFLKSNRTYRLAYKFDIYAELPLSHKIYYIDAITGDLLDTQELIMEINVNGTAQTRYSGSQSIVGDSYSGGYRLREVKNGVNIQTYNMNLGTNYGSATDFSDNDNNWTATEHNNTNLDNAALDAHWATEKVYDYFLNTHGRNSYDKAGGALLNYVHANLVAMGYSNNVNAFWDGQRMTYGDGGGFYGPVVSLDVVAHEIGHGVLQHSGLLGGLRYRGESGALNEGLSDIWGACVEAQVAPTKQKWLIGEDLGSPFRSMSNPNAYGDPDTYNGTNWRNPNDLSYDYGGVHTNSGVLNHWFYLLTEGGSGTNDINSTFNVNGIGISDAQSIVYKTLNEFISNNYDADFNFMRTSTIQAAIDLFGAGSCQEISVTNAWYAVGVGNSYQGNYAISGPSTFCSSATYSVSGLPSGATITWSTTGNTHIAGSSTGNQVNLETDVIGDETLTATISLNTCGNTNIVLEKNIFASYPADEPAEIYGADEYTTFCYAEEYYLSVDPFYESYDWRFYDDGEIISGYGTSSIVVQMPPSSFHTEVRIEVTVASCGEIYTKTVNIPLENCADFAVYPNPVSSELKVGFNQPQSSSVQNPEYINAENSFDELKLFNNKGELVKSVKNSKNLNLATLNVEDVPNGTYFLHIIKGKKTTKKQIIIKH